MTPLTMPDLWAVANYLANHDRCVSLDDAYQFTETNPDKIRVFKLKMQTIDNHPFFSGYLVGTPPKIAFHAAGHLTGTDPVDSFNSYIESLLNIDFDAAIRLSETDLAKLRDGATLQWPLSN